MLQVIIDFVAEKQSDIKAAKVNHHQSSKPKVLTSNINPTHPKIHRQTSQPKVSVSTAQHKVINPPKLTNTPSAFSSKLVTSSPEDLASTLAVKKETNQLEDYILGKHLIGL